MDILIVGFALFSLFFGAGNLIFPPLLGKIYESDWIIASIGFIFTGVGLASLAIISMAKRDGDIRKFTSVGGEKLGYAITILIALTLGPLGAIPRTGATSGEVIRASGVNIPYYLFVIIFFGLSLYVILSGNNIIDLIGKYLTPALILVLLVMIVAGIANPIGPIGRSSFQKNESLTRGIIEGYNTMDALSAIAFAPIIINSLKNRGSREKIVKDSIIATLIAGLGLAVVYISLAYLGASSSVVHHDINSRVNLLVAIASSVLGNNGKYILTLIIVLACFTTSVGLISSISDMLYKVSDGKYSYNFIVIATTVISLLLSMVGVDQFIMLTSPLLSFAYPIVLVMIVFNILNVKTSQNSRLATFSLVGIVALIQTIAAYINMVDVNTGTKIEKLISWLPFYNIGFPWLLIFVVMIIFSILKARTRSSIT